MRFWTRSRTVVQAAATVLRLMPARTRQDVEKFVVLIRASKRFEWDGIGPDFDRSPAVFAPISMNFGGDKGQVIVTLPIFRLFSQKAQVGIIARMFAHGARAARIGYGWKKEMRSQYYREPQLTDALARRWGFSSYITTLERETARAVNPILDAQAPEILRRMTDQEERDMEAAGIPTGRQARSNGHRHYCSPRSGPR